MSVLIQFQMRLDTAANWASANPVLLAAELGLDTTVGRWKAGDGTTAWNSLSYSMNTLLSGTGTPSAGLGVNGDIYIDVTPAAQKVFGPKVAGAWGAGQTIVGSQGIQGIPGNAGTNGQGVPTGGTTHQVLRKIDATNYNTEWDSLDLSDLPNAAANSVRGEFTGSASTAQDLAMAVNTFLARSSSGNLASKPLSDLGLSWVGLSTTAAQTAALNVVTQSLQGMMTALDKKMIDNLHYDFVADFGGVGNDSTLNDTAMATALSTMPAGACLFFPAGTYRFAAAIDINVDKRLTFRGVNRYASIIKTTSATAHIFTKSVAGWYDMWTDLGFQSSVTKTAGAAINIPIGNNIGMNVYRCWFTGMFQAINATGNQSANLSVWSDLDISAITNGGRGIYIDGATINVMIHNVTINGGAATTSACCEIRASGAVQVTNCDWIQGTNVVLFNAAAALGAQACYFTNCFFDQPQGSVVKIIGGFTAGRLNFSQCGIAPTGNNHAVEVNGTGAGAVGTATALPAGVKMLACDIYSANGTNTGAGVRVNGCQDITVQNCNISGFNGTGGAAVWITPSASNLTKVRVNGNILGPNSNLTVNNATGVLIDAGSSALGFLSITDNSMIGCTTAITDNSSSLAAVTKNINNNQGAAGGLQGQFISAGGLALSVTEQIVMQIPLPANSMKLGTTFRFTMTGVSTTATVTIRARVGTAGTIADAGLVGMTSGALVAGGLMAQGQTQVTTVGASGVHTGTAACQGGTASSALAPAISGTFNTTVANFITITALCSVAGPTIRTGSIDVISPA